MVLNDHYAHRAPQVQCAWGLFEGETCVGCVTFGQPASPWVKRSPCGPAWQASVIELNRLVVNTPTRNAASTLVGHALRQLGNRIVVSYADQGAGHVGYVYQATNFEYCGASKPRTDLAPLGGHSRHYRPGETRRVTRSAKHRYLAIVGNRRFVRAVTRDKRWRCAPYPKGRTARH